MSMPGKLAQSGAAIMFLALAGPALANDGKVEHLNAAAYAVLEKVRTRAPDAFADGAQLTQEEIAALAAAIRKDGITDAAELDLLQELTQFGVRGINVYSGAASPNAKKLLFFPLSTATYQPLMDLRNEDARRKSEQAAAKPQVSDPALIDGKVSGLNKQTFPALQAIKKANPSNLTEKDANQLKIAIMADGKVDAVERDLLREMTQSQFRNIIVTPADTSATDKVMTFPVVGNAKKVLLYVLNPVPDLAAEWAKPDHNWNLIVADYKSGPEREAKVLAFVTEEMAKKWEVSTMGNGYKPLRDEIAKIYGLCNASGADGATGRDLLYKAMNMVDRKAQDAVPDFLYNWVRPGGSL